MATQCYRMNYYFDVNLCFENFPPLGNSDYIGIFDENLKDLFETWLNINTTLHLIYLLAAKIFLSQIRCSIGISVIIE